MDLRPIWPLKNARPSLLSLLANIKCKKCQASVRRDREKGDGQREMVGGWKRMKREKKV